MRRSLLVVACVMTLAQPLPAFAHGTDYRITGNDAVVAVEFFYSDKTPMQYAEVLVFSPGNDKVEYQNSRTDQDGGFAFFAKKPGDWRIKVNDGMGHAVHATVAVPPVGVADASLGKAGLRSPAPAPVKGGMLGNAPTGVKITFGLSMLLNLFLGLALWKRKPERLS